MGRAKVVPVVLLFAAVGVMFMILLGPAGFGDPPVVGWIMVVVGALFIALAGWILWLAGRPDWKGPGLKPGQVRRFRARRPLWTDTSQAGYFFAGIGVFAVGAVLGVPAGVTAGVAGLAAWVAWVFFGPVRGGRRTYVVAEDGLTIETPHDSRTVPWHDVTMAWHRPFAVDGGFSYHDFLELELESGDSVVVANAHRQTFLSTMVVTRVAEHVKRRLIETYDETGTVDVGTFRVVDRGVRADGRLLRWDPLWTFDRTVDREGAGLRITVDGVRWYTGRVPEPRIAIDVLTTLNERALAR